MPLSDARIQGEALSVNVVNVRNYKTEEERKQVVYVGRYNGSHNLKASPLKNQFKLAKKGDDPKPVLKEYDEWLRKQMESDTPARREIERLTELAREGDVRLACWCVDKNGHGACHGFNIKRLIEERLNDERPGICIGDDAEKHGNPLGPGQSDEEAASRRKTQPSLWGDDGTND